MRSSTSDTLLKVMAVPSYNLGFFLLVLFLITSGMGPKSRMPGAKARGHFRCPRMINCTAVCDGFPNCCVDGECICERCDNATASLRHSSSQTTT